MNRKLLTVIAILAAAGVAASQSGRSLPRASDVVKSRVYVSLDPVPRGRTFEVAVVARILPGFHINANKVLEDYLIPTTLEAAPPPGLHLTETLYPAGELKKFQFSDSKLNVYDGTITVRLKLAAREEAAMGAAKLPLTLRYQACNDSACLPPVRVPLTAEFQIAPATTKAKAIHPEIFRKSS